nr:LysR substrate-binding domain-containing protein [Teredinibacter turnerae]
MPACSSGLGKAQLLPLLPLFYRQFPEVDIQLLLEDRFAGLIDEQIDVAIGVGHLPDSSYVARRLGDMQWLLCASPAYLQRPRPAAPQLPLLPEHDPCYGYLAVSPR